MSQPVTFPDATPEMTWPEGYVLYRMRSEDDLDLLSQNGGGCSVAHHFWVNVVNPPMEYFFVLTKDNTIRVILFTKVKRLFRKAHPQEDERPRGDSEYRYARGTSVPSNLYDFGVRFHNGLDGAEENLAYFQRRYNEAKRRALQHGPINRDNPHKYDMDYYNREICTCKTMIENSKKEVLKAGHVFTYKRKKLVVMSISGVGTDYSQRPKYDSKLTEFALKGGPLGHVS